MDDNDRSEWAPIYIHLPDLNGQLTDREVRRFEELVLELINKRGRELGYQDLRQNKKGKSS